MSALILTHQNRAEADQVREKSQQVQQSVLPRSKTLWLAGKKKKALTKNKHQLFLSCCFWLRISVTVFLLFCRLSPLPPPHLSLRQLHFELLHLLPELPDDASVGVFVHHGVVDDPLGSVGVTQRGQGFLVVVGRGAHRGDHGRLAVAAQVVLSIKTNPQSCSEKETFWPPFSDIKKKCMTAFKNVVLFSLGFKPLIARWGLSLCMAQTWPSPFPQTDRLERKSRSLTWWETFKHTNKWRLISVNSPLRAPRILGIVPTCWCCCPLWVCLQQLQFWTRAHFLPGQPDSFCSLSPLNSVKPSQTQTVSYNKVQYI